MYIATMYVLSNFTTIGSPRNLILFIQKFSCVNYVLQNCVVIL